MRSSEIQELNKVELEEKMKETKEELFNLRFQHATGQLDNPMKLRDIKRQLARLLTAQREFELGIRSE